MFYLQFPGPQCRRSNGFQHSRWFVSSFFVFVLTLVEKEFMDSLEWPSYEIGQDIPAYMSASFSILEKATSMQGLFRISAGTSNVNVLCHKWKLGLVSGFEMAKEDVHVIAGAFGRALREQVPLLSPYDEFVVAGKNSRLLGAIDVVGQVAAQMSISS
jgi:hypothetical protein